MINSKSKVDDEKEKFINVDKNYIQHNEIRTLLKPPNTRSTTHTPHQENIIPPIVGRNNKIKRILKSSQLEEDGIKITKLLTFTTKEKLPHHSNKLKNQRPVDLEKDNKYYQDIFEHNDNYIDTRIKNPEDEFEKKEAKDNKVNIVSVINNSNDTPNKCSNNNNESRRKNDNGIKSTSFTSPAQVQNNRKLVECSHDTNNIIDEIAEKLNNSSKNNEHNNERLAKDKAPSTDNKTNILEDGAYNETDKDCEEVEVNERIGKTEDKEVHGINIGKGNVDNNMIDYDNKIVNHCNRSRDKSENTSKTILGIGEMENYFKQKQQKQLPRPHATMEEAYASSNNNTNTYCIRHRNSGRNNTPHKQRSFTTTTSPRSKLT